MHEKRVVFGRDFGLEKWGIFDVSIGGTRV